VAARAIWKGTISFGDVECPVKLYSALESQGIHFRLLHDRDRVPVSQKLVNPRTGKEVSGEHLRKGAVADKHRFVVLEPKELASVEPEPSRTIAVEHFVPSTAIDFAFYDRPYWVGPDGDAAAYAALANALADLGRTGIARWVMRKRAYVGALRAEGQHLMLVTLRHAGEVVAASEIEKPSARAPDPKELKMASQLVSALRGEFDPGELHDEYRARVLELVRRKGAGEKIEIARPQAKQAPSDLAAALKKSLTVIQGGKPHARRAEKRAHG
jgi:DNA end-binding protein Ku